MVALLKKYVSFYICYVLIIMYNCTTYCNKQVYHSSILSLRIYYICCLQEREAVPVEVANGEPGCQYYEQLCYNNMWLKVGDCVYIRSHGLIRSRIGRQVNYKNFPLTFQSHTCYMCYVYPPAPKKTIFFLFGGYG